MHSASSLLVLVGNLLCLALATICNAVGSQVPQLRAPALFWNHGSGPYPFLYPDDNAHKETVSFWKHEARQILRFDDAAAMRPKALVIISAHNEDQAEMGAVNINNAQDNIPLDKHDNPG